MTTEQLRSYDLSCFIVFKAFFHTNNFYDEIYGILNSNPSRFEKILEFTTESRLFTNLAEVLN